MPPAYSQNELEKMSKRAIESAWDMHRRAAIKDNRPPPKAPNNTPPPEPHRLPPPVKNPKPPVSCESDSDRLLIISLLIILSADNADMLLIFALIYILM